MSPDEPEPILRQMEPGDGPALAALSTASPDTGQITYSPHYHVDPYETFLILHPDTVGVVAEIPGRPGLAGAGVVRFGHCQFEGRLLPYAELAGLMVHPECRGRGIAAALARWRVACAERRLIDPAVLLAVIQQDNEGSFATARKWCSGFGGQICDGGVRMRATPPRPERGIRIRRAEESELDEVAKRLNDFYQDANLYVPHTAESLRAWLRRTPYDTPFRHYYVAVDGRGQPVAGLAISESSRLWTVHFHGMPPLMRLVNKVVRLVPSDGILRQLTVAKLWFAPGCLRAARFLWDTVRWEWRDHGNALGFSFDPRTPLKGVFRLRRWAPKGWSTLAWRAPDPLDPGRWIYPPE